jgi:hypothetical protein
MGARALGGLLWASLILCASLASCRKSSSTGLHVTSIAVTPAHPALAVGASRAFTAIATFSDFTTQDLTDTVSWSSSNGAVAAISNAPGSQGVASSLSVGSTLVTATDASSGISGSSVLDVTAAVLTSLAVTPTNPSIASGTGVAFTAIGTFSDLTTQDLTDTVTWSSSNSAVAAISNAPGSQGLATSVAIGATTISVVDPSSGLGDSTTLDVTAAVLTSLAITPTNPSIALGTTQQFTATGTYSDGSTQDLTTAVTWSSSNSAVAAISNASGSEGLATSVAAGSTTIGAIDPGTSISASTTLTITSNVVFRAAASAGSGSGVLSLTIATPAGTTAGDVLIASIGVRPSSAVITPPAAGWTLVRRIDTAGGPTSSLAIYRRVATAGEPVSHTWTLSTSTGSAGGIAAFYGVDTSNPVDVENGQATANALTHSTPSVSTTVADTMLVSSHGFSSAATWTPPAGMTEVVDAASQAVPNAVGLSLEVNYASQAAVGASGVKTATASNDADSGCTHLLALRRAP